MALVYIDMDNTLTELSSRTLHNYLETGDPHYLLQPPVLQIPPHYIILTRVSSREEARLKREWAHLYYPHNKIITTSLPKHVAVDPHNNILIDDYNINLDAWIQAGGIGVKYLNHMNSYREDIPCVRYIIEVRPNVRRKTPLITMPYSKEAYDYYEEKGAYVTVRPVFI